MKKIFYLTVALLIIVMSSCTFPGMIAVRPDGAYISKDIQPESFDNISISSGFELILTQDSTQTLTIESYENVFKHLKVEIVGNTLNIYAEKGVNFIGDPKVKIHISTPRLNELSLSGGSRADLQNGWKGSDMGVSLSGGSRIYGKTILETLSMELSGGSRSEIEGSANYFTISSSGGSKNRHFDMFVKKCNASISGGGALEISVSDSLDIDCSGGSRVDYKGTPAITSQLSGGSSLEKVD